MSETTHTPGIGDWDHPLEHNGNAVHLQLTPSYGTCFAIADGPTKEIARARAGFIRDCCASYLKVFGPHAVSAAEGGKLGEAVELLREATERIRLLEKYELTMCNRPGENRDDSISKFALGMTRKSLARIDDFLSTTKDTDHEQPR
jgi:hypothetical protein